MKQYSINSVYNKAGKLLPIETRTYQTLEGYSCILIKPGTKPAYVVGTINNYEFELSIAHVRTGKVKFPFHPSKQGKGFIGVGRHSPKDNLKAYQIWSDMLRRAYDLEYHKKRPTYTNVTVCEKWHNYQQFMEWFLSSNYQEGWQLDKDLLATTDYKVYSEDNCIFLPLALNTFLSKHQSNNTSGCAGVTWCKTKKKWKCRINDVNSNKSISLGYFIDFKEAVKVYEQKRHIQALVWQDKMKNLLSPDIIKLIN